MDIEELAQLRTRLQIYRKRMGVLEEQVARFGRAFVPAYILIDLDEAKEEAAQVAQRIESLSRAYPPAPAGQGSGVANTQETVQADHFDVFLCHNGEDKPIVKQIGRQLKAREISPWLDEWELRPGFPWQPLLEAQIERIASAAVFVGEHGIGPWQDLEMRAFLNEFVERQCPVIPVLLPNAKEKPKLPPFMKIMNWVNFNVTDPDPIDQLIFGITGKQPAR